MWCRVVPCSAMWCCVGAVWSPQGPQRGPKAPSGKPEGTKREEEEEEGRVSDTLGVGGGRESVPGLSWGRLGAVSARLGPWVSDTLGFGGVGRASQARLRTLLNPSWDSFSNALQGNIRQLKSDPLISSDPLILWIL